MVSGLWPQDLHLSRASVLFTCVVYQVSDHGTVGPPPFKVPLASGWWGVAVSTWPNCFPLAVPSLGLAPSDAIVGSSWLSWQITGSGLSSVGPQFVLTTEVKRLVPVALYPPWRILVRTGHGFLSSARSSGHLAEAEAVIHILVLLYSGLMSGAQVHLSGRNGALTGYLGGLHGDLRCIRRVNAPKWVERVRTEYPLLCGLSTQ